MFVHIPKTGGSSIREAMPPAYGKRFKWGSDFDNKKCGVHHSSTFHLTLDEMERCGLHPLPGPTLCVVRDPMSRFESEIGWRGGFDPRLKGKPAKQHPGLMIDLCKNARRSKDDDLFEHCQPQSTYLYRDAVSARGPGTAVCDYLMGDPSKHERLMKAILGKSVPHVNKSPRKHGWTLTKPQRVWVRSFYKRDFDDPAITLANEGKVLRRSGKGYVVIEV
jgi:hypothetical protein